MKFNKIILLGACVMAMAATSCSDVTEPVVQKPDASKFVMNVPPLQNQYFELVEGNTFDLVIAAQPDYGFSAITQYRAEVSLTEDFAEYKTLTPTGTGTLVRMTFKCEDLAVALCELHGVTSDADYVDQGIEKVYFRGVAFISGVEESYVTTANIVSLNQVQGYFALPQGNFIFCIGNYESNWISPEEANSDALRPYRVQEKADEIGSKLYYASIDFQTNAPIFRFYTALTGWDADSWGAQGGTDTDTPVVFPSDEYGTPDFADGDKLTWGVVKTKDSFSFPNLTGGIINMMVKMQTEGDYTVTFTTGDNPVE